MAVLTRCLTRCGAVTAERKICEGSLPTWLIRNLPGSFGTGWRASLQCELWIVVGGYSALCDAVFRRFRLSGASHYFFSILYPQHKLYLKAWLWEKEGCCLSHFSCISLCFCLFSQRRFCKESTNTSRGKPPDMNSETNINNLPKPSSSSTS